MMPVLLSPGTIDPAPVAVPVLAAGVAPRARQSQNHVAGEVTGTATKYGDLHAFAWFVGGGRELRGPRRAFDVSGMRGAEDGKQRKQQ